MNDIRQPPRMAEMLGILPAILRGVQVSHYRSIRAGQASVRLAIGELNDC